jgi:hypothetical protein
MYTARRVKMSNLAIDTFFFLVGAAFAILGLFWEPGLTLGGLSVLLSLAIALLSLVPIFIAWNFNRKPRS